MIRATFIFVFIAVLCLIGYNIYVRNEKKKAIERARIVAIEKEKFEKWAKTAPVTLKKVFMKHRKKIRDASRKHNVPEDIIAFIITVESGGNPKLCSSKGACGLMGVKPIAARDTKSDSKCLLEPECNIKAGTKYLAKLKQRYGFLDLEKRLLAYNAGPTGVRALLREKPANEHIYVKKIKFLKQFHSEHY